MVGLFPANTSEMVRGSDAYREFYRAMPDGCDRENFETLPKGLVRINDFILLQIKHKPSAKNRSKRHQMHLALNQIGISRRILPGYPVNFPLVIISGH